jgi:Protein of unknown function (DUF3137)
VTDSKPIDPTNLTIPQYALASLQQVKNHFDRVLITDFRQLEQTRRSTIDTIIVAVTIFSILLGGILIGSWYLFKPVPPKVQTEIVSPPTICPTGIAQSDCDLLKSNPQVADYIAQHKSDSNDRSGSIVIDFIQIPIAIFFAIISLGWIFMTFVGGAIDNYRVGWRARMVRKLIDVMDIDRVMTYVGESSATDMTQSLLHSGMVNLAHDELILVEISDAIVIKLQDMNITWAYVRATTPTRSILSVLDTFCRVVYDRSGLQRIVKFNFALLLIKAIRVVIFLLTAVFSRQLDFDVFDRQLIGNDAGKKTIFNGIFCQILLPETSELGQMLVIPKQPNLQPIGFKVPPHLNNIVKMGDSKFDRIFTIYSQNSTTPTQILSPTMRRHAIDYHRTSKYPIYLSINDRTLYLSIVTPTQFLEPQLTKNMLDFTPIEDYDRAIRFILNIGVR